MSPRKKWSDLTIVERRASVLRRAVKAGDLRVAMYHLPWPRIITKAIENRPTSFGMPNGSKAYQWDGISEWRNATDEIMMSCIQAMQEAGLIPKNYL